MGETLDVPSLINAFRCQMDIIRQAIAAVNNIIEKLSNISMNSVSTPPPETKRPSRNKRKIDEPNIQEAKKKRESNNSSDEQQLVGLDSNKLPAITQLIELTDDQNTELKNCPEFEFSAVLPMKKVFVSRLPLGITKDILERHILKRLPNCSDSLSISFLDPRRNVDYSSVLLSVGRNEEHFRIICSDDFWPPATIVHQHHFRSKPSNGFRSQRNNWRRRN